MRPLRGRLRCPGRRQLNSPVSVVCDRVNVRSVPCGVMVNNPHGPNTTTTKAKSIALRPHFLRELRKYGVLPNAVPYRALEIALFGAVVSVSSDIADAAQSRIVQPSLKLACARRLTRPVAAGEQGRKRDSSPAGLLCCAERSRPDLSPVSLSPSFRSLSAPICPLLISSSEASARVRKKDPVRRHFIAAERHRSRLHH
jgi:hypothetical protein